MTRCLDSRCYLLVVGMSSQKQKKFGAENRQAKKRRLLEESAKKCKSLDNFFASGISPGADDGMGVTSRLLDYPPIESQFQPCGHMPDEVASPNILCDTTSNNLIGPLESATPTGPTIADEVALSGTQCATTPQPPIEAATSVTPLVSLTSATPTPPDLSDEIASSSSQCQGYLYLFCNTIKGN